MRPERVSAVVLTVLLVLSATAATVPTSAFTPMGNLGAEDATGNSSDDVTTLTETTTTVANDEPTTLTETTVRETTTTTKPTKRTATANRKSNPKIASSLLDRIDSTEPEPSVDGTRDTRFVQVVVRASPGRSDEVAGLVGTNGGEVQVRHEDLVQARVPAAAVRALADSPAVEFVRRPYRPDTNEIVSEGLSNMDVNTVHDAGYTGENVTVAVVDVGFDVTNPEISDQLVDWRNFSSPDPLTMSNRTGEHGTAAAELVTDTAPNASIIAVKVGSEVELYEAIDWLESNTSTDVVTMSLSWYSVGPLDGTAQMDREINASIRNGTTWLTSAGNDGNHEYWGGAWSDPDNDDWLNFEGSDERLNVTPAGGSGRIDIEVSWDDWEERNEDYDAYLVNETGTVIASSERAQYGLQRPMEWLYGYTSQNVYLQIQRYDANGTEDFNIFFRGSSHPEYGVRSHTITIPAAGRNIITVGAAWHENNELASYSSRGPTVDGRVKPDVVGPTGVQTSEHSSFGGTSASTPYAAGVVALMLDADESLTPEQVKSRLTSSAVPLRGTEPNNRTGYGLVDADGAIRSVAEKYSDRVAYSGTVAEADGTVASDDEIIGYRLDSTDTIRGRTDGTGAYSMSPVGTEGKYAIGYFQGNWSRPDSTYLPLDGSPDLYNLDIVNGRNSSDLGTVTLPRAHVLNVTVVDESGDPVPYAEVEVMHFRRENGTWSHVDFSSETREDGVFTAGGTTGIEVVGEVRVRAGPPDGSTRFAGPSYTAIIDVQSDRNVTITLEEIISVSGQVTDANGNPSSDDLLYLYTESSDSSDLVYTNPTGNFSATGLAAGESHTVNYYQNYRGNVTTFPKDGTPDVYVLDEVNATTDVELGHLDLPTASLLNVRVVNESGDPVKDAAVNVTHHRLNKTARIALIQTDSGGYMRPYETRGMEVTGDVTVEVTPPENSMRYPDQTYVRNLTATSDRNITVTLDGSGPEISNFDLKSVPNDENQLFIEFDANEKLSNYRVNLTDANGNVVETFTNLGFSDEPTHYKYSVSTPVSGDGVYRATLVNASDALGNDDFTGDVSDETTVDTTAPTVSAHDVTDEGDNAKVSDGERVSVAVNVSDELSAVESVTADASELGAGTVELFDSDGDGTYRGNFKVDASGLPDGNAALFVTATDAHGNDGGELLVQQFSLDVHAPNTTHTISGTVGDADWYTSAVEVNFTATDGTSSVARTEYRVNGGDWTTYTGNFSVAYDGMHDIKYRSIDEAGNVEANRAVEFDIDASAPMTLLDANVSANENGWYNSSVNVTFTAIDVYSGVNATYYRIDGGMWKQYDASAGVPLTADGEYTVEFYSVDDAGNSEMHHSETVKIDTVKPVLDGTHLPNKTGILPEHAIPVVVDAHDGNGVTDVVVDGVRVGPDGDGFVPTAPALGNHTFEVIIRDVAGNELVVRTANYSVGRTVEMRKTANGTLSAKTNDTNVGVVSIETEGSTTEANVTVGTANTNPTPQRGDPDPNGAPLYFPQIDTSIPNDAIENATVTVTVEKSRVRQKYVLPNSVEFWVEEENEATGWQKVNATLLGETEGTYTYEIEAPHFSTYAITGQTERTAPSVTAFDTANESPAPGDVTLTAAYGDDYSGVDPANVTLELEDADVTDEATVTATGVTFTENLSAGTYNATLFVTDNAGNSLESPATLTFTVADESTGGGSGGGGGGGGDLPEPAVRVELLDVTPSSARAKVTSARTGAPGRVAPDGGISAGDLTVRRVAFTPLSHEATARFFATVRVTQTPPSDVSAPEVRTLGYVNVSTTYVLDSELRSVGVRFAVPVDAVAAPENVALYRLVDGSWRAVETTVVGRRGGSYVLEANAPATGTFAVGAVGGDLSVTDAAVGANRVEPGDTVEVTATVENVGDGAGVTTVELAVDGDAVATKHVSVAAGESKTVAFEVTLDDPGRHDLTVNGVSAGSVTVGATTTTPPEDDGSDDATTATPDGGSGGSGGIPGFGVSTGLAALLAGLLVARKRA